MMYLKFIIRITCIAVIFLTGCQSKVQAPSDLPPKDDTIIEDDKPNKPYKRRRRRRGGGGGGDNDPPTVNTACPAENPDSSYKLADIAFGEYEDEDGERELHYQYINPLYRYRRYEDSTTNFDPRDWGRSSPNQNILLRLDNYIDTAVIWVTLNKALIQYEAGKTYYMYLDGRRFGFELDSEYPSTNGVTHIIFFLTNSAGERAISALSVFGNEITVHLASGTENSCVYFQQD